MDTYRAACFKEISVSYLIKQNRIVFTIFLLIVRQTELQLFAKLAFNGYHSRRQGKGAGNEDKFGDKLQLHRYF